MLDLDEALARFAETLHLTIDADTCDVRALAAELRTAMPGRCTLRLRLRTPTSQGDLVPGPNWRLRPTLTLLESLRTRPGILDIDLRVRRASGLAERAMPPTDTRDHDEALAQRYATEA